MEPLFQFLGSYWWLVFPLMGVMGMIGSAWERGARRRHKRRLEILQAKGEIRAAQAAARGRPLIGVTLPGAKAPKDPLAQRVEDTVAAGMGTAPRTATASSSASVTPLHKLLAAHDAVTKRWLEYELDVAKIIAFPAMSDGRQPLTAAFLRAKKVADRLRPESETAKLSKEQFAEYRNAATDYEVAFDLAEREARRIRDSSFTAEERKRLTTAQQLLSVAIDQAATPAERQLAYRRVREELDGLLAVSDEAITVLEERVALELPASSPTAAAAQASAAPASAPATGTGVSTPTPPAATSPAVEPPASPTSPGIWPVPSRTQRP